MFKCNDSVNLRTQSGNQVFVSKNPITEFWKSTMYVVAIKHSSIALSSCKIQYSLSVHHMCVAPGQTQVVMCRRASLEWNFLSQASFAGMRGLSNWI